MSKMYKRRIKEITGELESLNKRIDMLGGLDIEMGVLDIPNDLLNTVKRILSHAESEIEDIYHILYRIKIDQINKNKEG